MRNVVLLGANGMLGRAWRELLQAKDIGHLAVGHAEVDITDAAAVENAVRPDTEWVINCAAYTAVDDAETHETVANEVNGYATGRIAERCAEVGAKLLHYSTDYVFDGTANEPYRSDRRRNPVNAYGRSKALGEELLEQTGAEYLLIRGSWLYAPWGDNFVLTIRRLAQNRESLRVVDDQRGRPTDCRRLSEVSLRLANQGCRGIFHVTDGGECTWFGLASLVAEITNPSCQVVPCTSEEFLRPAPRPAYSVLDTSATESIAGPLVPWEERVRDVLAHVRD